MRTVSSRRRGECSRLNPTSRPSFSIHFDRRCCRSSKRNDAAVPGKHTRLLYGRLSRKEASVLAQLRTGMAKLNAYLHRIEAAPSDQCACGKAREIVDHFMFRCKQWVEHRTDMPQCIDVHRDSLSFYLGGKSPPDGKTGPQKCKQCGQLYGLPFPTGRLDASRPQNETDKPFITNPTSPSHLVPRRLSTLQLPKIRR